MNRQMDGCVVGKRMDGWLGRQMDGKIDTPSETITNMVMLLLIYSFFSTNKR